MSYSSSLNLTDGELMKLTRFLSRCQIGEYTNDDGYAYPVKDMLADMAIMIFPSELNIPNDATHILWFEYERK